MNSCVFLKRIYVNEKYVDVYFMDTGKLNEPKELIEINKINNIFLYPFSFFNLINHHIFVLHVYRMMHILSYNIMDLKDDKYDKKEIINPKRIVYNKYIMRIKQNMYNYKMKKEGFKYIPTNNICFLLHIRDHIKISIHLKRKNIYTINKYLNNIINIMKKKGYDEEKVKCCIIICGNEFFKKNIFFKQLENVIYKKIISICKNIKNERLITLFKNQHIVDNIIELYIYYYNKIVLLLLLLILGHWDILYLPFSIFVYKYINIYINVLHYTSFFMYHYYDEMKWNHFIKKLYQNLISFNNFIFFNDEYKYQISDEKTYFFIYTLISTHIFGKGKLNKINQINNLFLHFLQYKKFPIKSYKMTYKIDNILLYISLLISSHYVTIPNFITIELLIIRIYLCIKKYLNQNELTAINVITPFYITPIEKKGISKLHEFYKNLIIYLNYNYICILFINAPNYKNCSSNYVFLVNKRTPSRFNTNHVISMRAHNDFIYNTLLYHRTNTSICKDKSQGEHIYNNVFNNNNNSKLYESLVSLSNIENFCSLYMNKLLYWSTLIKTLNFICNLTKSTIYVPIKHTNTYLSLLLFIVHIFYYIINHKECSQKLTKFEKDLIQATCTPMLYIINNFFLIILNHIRTLINFILCINHFSIYSILILIKYKFFSFVNMKNKNKNERISLEYYNLKEINKKMFLFNYEDIEKGKDSIKKLSIFNLEKKQKKKNIISPIKYNSKLKNYSTNNKKKIHSYKHYIKGRELKHINISAHFKDSNNNINANYNNNGNDMLYNRYNNNMSKYKQYCNKDIYFKKVIGKKRGKCTNIQVEKNPCYNLIYIPSLLWIYKILNYKNNCTYNIIKHSHIFCNELMCSSDKSNNLSYRNKKSQSYSNEKKNKKSKTNDRDESSKKETKKKDNSSGPYSDLESDSDDEVDQDKDLDDDEKQDEEEQMDDNQREDRDDKDEEDDEENEKNDKEEGKEEDDEGD